MRADLSAMRVHTGPAADPLARGPGAEAFAGGSHVFFRRGAYRPRSPSGFRLAGPRSRPPRPAGPWRGRRSQARRVDRQRARRPLGAGDRPLGRGELVRRLMRELGLAPCLPRPRRFNPTQAAAGRVPDLVGRNFTADAPGKSSSMT
ncbi:eCIS core domain-containing protein [Streptomyces capitiformicae]|uniref:eCIS core domain-containing protein n=1 Tax=Streptomyces capitiformicae TaxID=2014920 RepID=UPI003570DD31